MGSRSLEREGFKSKDEETDELVDKLFADEQVAERVAQDPLYRFLKNNWRQLFVMIAGLAAAFFIYGKFTQTYVMGMERASAVYSQTQREYSEYLRLGDMAAKAEADALKSGADKKAEAEKKAADLKSRRAAVKSKLDASIAALENEKRPYSSLAAVYRALAARADGDIEAVRAALKGFDWKTPSDPDSKDRFAAELAGLVLAKALLDQPSTFDEGRTGLKSLAENGSTVNIAAAVAFLRSARNADERGDALALAENLKEKHPEQKSLLDTEMGGQF